MGEGVEDGVKVREAVSDGSAVGVSICGVEVSVDIGVEVRDSSEIVGVTEAATVAMTVGDNEGAADAVKVEVGAAICTVRAAGVDWELHDS